jgi:hypothetical protein
MIPFFSCEDDTGRSPATLLANLAGHWRVDQELLRHAPCQHVWQRYVADPQVLKTYTGTVHPRIDTCLPAAGIYHPSLPLFRNTPLNPMASFFAQVDRVMLQEAFELGERVRAWSVEVQSAGSNDWSTFASGTVIGWFCWTGQTNRHHSEATVLPQVHLMFTHRFILRLQTYQRDREAHHR